jgi:endogenous inhibitor of DNA gyrase (YacG/DUF329 family)
MPNAPKPCPLCGEPPSPEHTPFCSRGCKDRDLLKWLGEGYRIPGPPADEDALDSEGLDSDRGDR